MNSTTVTIYSHFADAPEWRISRSAQGLSTEPTWTGEIEVQDLDDIFRFFNRVDQNDCDRLEKIGYRLPSLSMGDVILAGSDYHMVALVGFHTITKEEFETYKAIPFREKLLWQHKFLRSCNATPIF